MPTDLSPATERLSMLSGHENMALDAALLEAAEREGKAGWRVYGWDGPWVSLGMGQRPERDLLEPNLAPWVMRPTGGKAVLHGHDVTVCMAVPLSAMARSSPATAEALARSIKLVYRWMCAPIAASLEACGLPAVLAEGTVYDRRGIERLTTAADRPDPSREKPAPPARPPRPSEPPFEPPPPPGPEVPPVPRPEPPQPGQPFPPEPGPLQPPRPRTADCFGHVSPNDIVDRRTGMKVCGCALRVTRCAALLQASIPAGAPLIDPRLVFERPSQIVAPPWEAGKFAQVFERRMMGLWDESDLWDEWK